MNLLTLSNRTLSIEETSGYIKALVDLNDYLKLITDYDPAKRMVDSVKLLASISDTGEAITRGHRQIEADIILKNIPNA